MNRDFHVGLSSTVMSPWGLLWVTSKHLGIKDAAPVGKAGRGCTRAHGLRALVDSTWRELPLLN